MEDRGGGHALHMGYVVIWRKRTEGIGERFKGIPREFIRAFERLGKLRCTWVMEGKYRRRAKVEKNTKGSRRIDELNVTAENEPMHALRPSRDFLNLNIHSGRSIRVAHISL